MDTSGGGPRSGGEGELLSRIGWLRRTELDLHRRLAERRAALGGVRRPISDPLYQRLYFVHKNLSEERACAERDLAEVAGAAFAKAEKPGCHRLQWTDCDR